MLFGVLDSFDVLFQVCRVLIKRYDISECRSFLPLRLKINITSKLLDDLLGDVKSQANALSVEILGCLEETEQFEEFIFVLFFDADSIVSD